jgi:hypothetical protein
MDLGSTQSLTEMSARDLPGGEGLPARNADNPTAICEPIVQKMWESRRVTTLWACTACYRDSLTYFFIFSDVMRSIPLEVCLLYRTIRRYIAVRTSEQTSSVFTILDSIPKLAQDFRFLFGG